MTVGVGKLTEIEIRIIPSTGDLRFTYFFENSYGPHSKSEFHPESETYRFLTQIEEAIMRFNERESE